VSPTRAGEAFRDSTADVLSAIDRSAEASRAAAAGTSGTLTVGFQWNTYPWIALAGRTFEWENPSVRVVYRQSAFGDPTAGLSDVDVTSTLAAAPPTVSGMARFPSVHSPS
jgi:DNA-binding transcriptional LysR family regulator